MQTKIVNQIKINQELISGSRDELISTQRMKT